MVDAFCKLAGAELLSDPEPVSSKRYRSVTWCSTDSFLLMDSWSNGELRGNMARPKPACNWLLKHVRAFPRRLHFDFQR